MMLDVSLRERFHNSNTDRESAMFVRAVEIERPSSRPAPDVRYRVAAVVLQVISDRPARKR
jgi:hypothetical protein